MIKQPQLIIYTRNRVVDYRMVITPDENLCPAETRKYFRKLIRGAVDVETYDDPLTEPRWLFARKDNVILFGVAIMLEAFGTEFCTDFTGRNVRGFYGIVMDTSFECLRLPYTIDFFKAINERYIEPLWDATKDDLVRKSIEVDFCGDSDQKLTAAKNDLPLNVNPNECLVLGQVEVSCALQEALAYGGNISLISGLNSKQHAFSIDADYDFMNAIVNGVSEREIFKREEINNQTKTSGAIVTPPPFVPQSKKAFRPKMVIALVIVAVIITVVMLLKSCHAMQTSHNSLTSGDQSKISQTETI